VATSWKRAKSEQLHLARFVWFSSFRIRDCDCCHETYNINETHILNSVASPFNNECNLLNLLLWSYRPTSVKYMVQLCIEFSDTNISLSTLQHISAMARSLIVTSLQSYCINMIWALRYFCYDDVVSLIVKDSTKFEISSLRVKLSRLSTSLPFSFLVLHIGKN